MESERQPLTLFEIAPSMQDVCRCSLDIISNASSHQIQAAIDRNKHEINTLLLQLLTINFIQKNEQIIQNERKEFNNNNNNMNNTRQLENYCNQKLLEISPIHGFSPKPYFLDYKISDDIRMEILTYLKPIQLFKTITLLNKQFNKNVKKIHASPNEKYSQVFETSNFTFDSFLEMEEYCKDNKRKALHGGCVYVDYRNPFGFWSFDHVKNIKNYCQCIFAGTCLIPLDCSKVAPYRSMTFRHCSKGKFENKIVKRGYLNETCDVNISKYSFTPMNNFQLKFDLSRGYIDASQVLNDFWICGKINFGLTLQNIFCRTSNRLGITVTTDDVYDNNKYKKLYDRIKGSFNIFQIYVDIDITKYYNKYSPDEKAELHTIGGHHISNLNGRHVLTVVAHGDDASTLTYFGDKSSIDERREIVESGFCDVHLSEPKRDFLDLIDYPNYCLATASFQPVSRMESEEDFNEWMRLYNELGYPNPSLTSCDVMTCPIDKNMLKHIYYDEKKDELHVKSLCFGWTLIFKDSDAPEPLKSVYSASFASPECRKLVDLIITEPDIVDIGNELYPYDDDEKTRCKKHIYFEKLSKWKGVIKCTVDITDVFNGFQNRLRDEWIGNKKKSNESDRINIASDPLGNNRRYFTNFNGKDMPYLQWERHTNKIKHDYYLHSISSVDYNYRLKLSDLLGHYKYKILSKIIFYTCTSNKDKLILNRVCREWQDILRNSSETTVN